ncbi:MAG: VOC family protein [Thermoleophilia bacterium]
MPQTATIPATTTVGAVRLRVADLAGAAAFYRRAVGLRDVGAAAAAIVLGVRPGAPLVELVGDAAAAPPGPRATGLFHLAILVPERADLARALHRAIGAGARLTGAADHLVSEALYLDDPEGNGIEICRDRPRQEWRRDADGALAMATLPLDIDGLLAAHPGDRAAGDEGMPPGARMGHVHLRVRDISEAEAFYAGLLGFDVAVRGYPGALFVSAGGYHHHIGLNTWGSLRGAPPPPGSRGLDRVTIVVPGRDALARIAAALDDAGVPARREGDAVATADPSGNRLLLTPQGP